MDTRIAHGSRDVTASSQQAEKEKPSKGTGSFPQNESAPLHNVAPAVNSETDPDDSVDQLFDALQKQQDALLKIMENTAICAKACRDIADRLVTIDQKIPAAPPNA